MSTVPLNAFTVDVESWCHASTERFDSLPKTEQRDGILRGLNILLGLLDQHHHKGTFFVLGSVAEAIPEAVHSIQNAGHEIGSHGFHHKRIDTLTPQEFESDLVRSKMILESLTGNKINAYRSPMWSLYRVRQWACAILTKQGFQYDSSLFPIPHIGHTGLPRTPYDIQTQHGILTEIPPLSSRKLFPMGGTWGLRTLPYIEIARAVRNVNRSGHPGIFYLHPWEIDPWRPPLRQPFLTRATLTIRLINLQKRLHRLFSEFSFAPLTEILNGTPRPTVTPEDLP